MSRIKEILKKNVKDRDQEDLIYIGQVAKGLLESEAGELINWWIDGRINEYATPLNNMSSNADRILGRIEGLNEFRNNLNALVNVGDNVHKDTMDEALEDALEEELIEGPEY